MVKKTMNWAKPVVVDDMVDYEGNDIKEEGYTNINIALDSKYFFREIPNNYTISTRSKDKNNKWVYRNLCYYTTPIPCLNYYILHCSEDKRNISTVDRLITQYTKREERITKVLKPLNTFKRKLEFEYNDAKIQILNNIKLMDRYKKQIKNLKDEIKELKG